jgi:hypothetical protein
MQSGSKRSRIEQPNSSTPKERKHSPNFASEEVSGSQVNLHFCLCSSRHGGPQPGLFRHARDTHTTEKRIRRGRLFTTIIKTAQTKGSGWVEYWLPKPGQTEPSQKWNYIEAVKAEGVAVVGAGFFPE